MCNSVVNIVVMGLILGQSLMVISTVAQWCNFRLSSQSVDFHPSLVDFHFSFFVCGFLHILCLVEA